MKSFRLIPVLAALLSLAGCTFPSGDDLLAAPKASANYQSLQVELEALLASGVTYTAPSGGENRSSVQLVDLDGDGTDEAIAFFRGASSVTSNEFTVYFYKKQEEKYVCTGSVDGQATEIESVEYPAVTPDGRRGMVIAWRLPGNGVSALTMCDFDAGCAPGLLLETEYSAMKLTDLTGDGAKDLLLISVNPAGQRVARLYQYGDGLTLAGEAPTSTETVSVERMTAGRVQDGLAAVFAEQKTVGGVGLTTDIFVYADKRLQNLALDGEDSINRGTYRPVSVYAADVNADGITELPRAVLMAGYTDAAAADALFMLDWYRYSVSTAPELVQTTYQNVADGWSFTIDPAWHDRITASKRSENGLSAVEFAQYSDGERRALFTIYCAAGAARDYYDGRTDLLRLGQTSKAVYFARIAEGAQRGAIRVDEQTLHDRFSVLTQDWSN